MRIDKFLKVARIIKRRTIAKEFCDAGKVQLNGKLAKAGDTVRLGDIVTIQFGQRFVQYRVMALAEHASKETAQTMVEEV